LRIVYGPTSHFEVGKMSVPSHQVSPYELRLDASGQLTHLTMDELARRWRRKRKTVERHYQRWGLRPLRLGGRLLFPHEQVLEVERRAIRGEVAQAPPGGGK
jgi:hypothetical protein